MSPLQVAFENDTLDGAVEEVIRMASYVGQNVTFLPGVSTESFNLTVPQEVRAYLMKAAQSAYERSGCTTAGLIQKVVYRGVGVVFEPIIADELHQLNYDKTLSNPIHVAQFWKHLGKD